MMRISRRGLVGAATIAPLARSMLGGVSFAGTAQAAEALLLYDRDLPAGARFAARLGSLGSTAHALDGDRILLLRHLLADAPKAIFGVTRFADYLLVADVAREHGYRQSAFVQRRHDGSLTTTCGDHMAAVSVVADLSGARWPEAFAELAHGGVGRCEHAFLAGQPDSAMSWALDRSI